LDEGVRLLERDASSALRQPLDDAATGHGRLPLVGGEAGVGMTALVHAFSEEASRRVRVLEGACDALFTPRP
jgi:predicted ATPase